MIIIVLHNAYILNQSDQLHHLSSTERRLLLALTRNARASVTALAQQLDVSRATVQAGLSKLVTSGVIQRFTIEVDPGAGVEIVRAVTLIEVQGHMTRSLVSALRALSGVVSVHSTNGAWDLIAQIEATSLSEFDQLLREIREIPGILNSQTNILLDVA
ncbi:Lrp/AsnC family transcriptional regulator [Gymnodinialimonas sp. 2305UL16-5]|uniref:Lrp/AsnC family transcriptional regulator n=1 Tax=Gymnodinialimonas mytili TaxID=3126503 RepID=UPI0030B76F6E